MTRERVPAGVFFNILAQTDNITMGFSTFPDIWISSAHEREITSGSLPFSGCLGGVFWRRQSGDGEPHASRAGGMVADIYIYI